uniref:Uncharacterized protein n=1 Tax=Ditylenchus dipsaci TaxID=166011 RepID=A0A915EFF4_9BILA
MVKHRRYATKKRKGALIDPVNRNLLGSKTKRQNLDPSSSQLGNQPVSRKAKELSWLTKKVDELQKVKRKPKCKNRFLEETSKLGYNQKPWESAENLLGRINRDQWNLVDEQLVKARFGAAGRDIKEIVEDYKEVDEKEKRRKLEKIARREKLKKLREKEKEFKEKQSRKRKTSEDGDSILLNNSSGDEEKGGSEGSSNESDDDQPSEQFEQKEIQNSRPAKHLRPESPKKKQRLGKRDKLRLKKKSEKAEAACDFLLNAQEVIQFGDRVDAPPVFSGKNRKTMDPLFSQAGKKDLLLKKKLCPASSKNKEMPQTQSRDVTSSQKQTIVKRQTNANLEPLGKIRKTNSCIDFRQRELAIEAYRKIKKITR